MSEYDDMCNDIASDFGSMLQELDEENKKLKEKNDILEFNKKTLEEDVRLLEEEIEQIKGKNERLRIKLSICEETIEKMINPK